MITYDQLIYENFIYYCDFNLFNKMIYCNFQSINNETALYSFNQKFQLVESNIIDFYNIPNLYPFNQIQGINFIYQQNIIILNSYKRLIGLKFHDPDFLIYKQVITYSEIKFSILIDVFLYKTDYLDGFFIVSDQKNGINIIDLKNN